MPAPVMAAGALIPGWIDRLRAGRDRLLGNPRFRHWAARFPPTRRLARKRARDLFDLCAGFVYSQVLLACVELDVFAVLAAGPATVEALAQRLDLTPEAALRLMRAAAALELVEARGDGRFGLGPLGAALAGDAGIGAMISHHRALYGDLRDPVALLRGAAEPTAMAAFWPYSGAADPAALPADRVAAYTRLMSTSQTLVADQILDAYDLARHRCLLDVGGGDGTFLVAAARRAPSLRFVLFDLPGVVARGWPRFEAAGLAGRATAVGGDFHTDALPEGADVAALIRVLHDHDDAAVRALLASVRRALPPDGVLLVAEPMADADGAPRVGDAYFGFYLLAMGRGRARTAGELCGMLREAGFRRARCVTTSLPLQTGLIVASA